MPQVSQRQITILPNIGVENSIELGDFVLVSSRRCDDWIPKTYRRNVEALASLFTSIDHDIDNVGLIVRKRSSHRLEPFSESEYEKLSKVVDALAFAAHSRRRFRATMRDNYEFSVWTFPTKRAPRQEINIRNRRYGMRVVERKDHMIQIPLHIFHQVVGPNSIDQQLLTALLQCSSSDRDEDNRIMRAINWVNQSRTDTESVSDHARYLLVATAFEALLDTPDTNIRQYFIKTIQFLLGSSDELKKWADKFYQLRSKIIHGVALPELRYGTYKHSSILTLADIIFRQCLIRKLGLLNYWEDNVAEQVRREDVRRYLISNKERFSEVCKFKLTADEELSWTIFNHLHTIQRDDTSTTEDDCRRTLIALLELSLQGVKRLSHTSRLTAAPYKDQLSKYRRAFTSVLRNTKAKQRANLHSEFSAITPHPSDEWADASVRGTGFGSAQVITLDALMHASREVHDQLTHARYR